MTDRLLTYRDAARETTLSESTIRRLIGQGRFPRPVRLLPGRVVFVAGEVREAVDRLLAEQAAVEPAYLTRGKRG